MYFYFFRVSNSVADGNLKEARKKKGALTAIGFLLLAIIWNAASKFLDFFLKIKFKKISTE